MRVWIAQCLCPQRHCILATAGEAEGRDAADQAVLAPLREAVRKTLDEGSINPWCGLCHAKAGTWTYEVGRTRYASFAEARPELMKSAMEQAIVRGMWGDMPRSD